MTTRSARRKMGVGAALAAGVMASASASYACTNFFGDMTFQNASGSQTVTGDPNPNPGMSYCGGNPTWPLTAPAASTSNLTISSAPSSNPACPGHLIDDTYKVTVAKGFMSGGALPKHINCHQTNGVVTAGNFIVTGGGGIGGPTTYSYNTASLRVGWNNICVWGTAVGNSDANDTNIQVV